MRFTILWLIVLSVLSSEDSESKISHLEWSGGSLPLAETATWLNQTGNKTHIETATQEAEEDGDLDFPFSSGTYWEGVLAVMEHHRLSIVQQEGERGILFNRNPAAGTGVQYPALNNNPVRLKRSSDFNEGLTRHLLLPCGPVLLEIQDARVSHYRTNNKSSVEIGYVAHLEPRLSNKDIGYVALMWKPLGQGDHVIPWPQELSSLQQGRLFRETKSYLSRLRPNVVRSESLSILPINGLDLEAVCEVAYTSLNRNNVTLNFEETKTFRTAQSQQDWKISFLPPKDNRNRYQRIVIEVPRGENYQGSIIIDVKDADGKRLPSHGSSTNSINGQLTQSKFIRNATSLPLSINIDVQTITSKTTHPISSHIIFPQTDR